MTQPNRYCQNCGAVLSPTARFCEKCGQPVTSQPVAAAVYPAKLPASPGSKKWLIIGLGAVGLVFLFCCAAVAGYSILQPYLQQGALPGIPQIVAPTASPVVARPTATPVPPWDTPTVELPSPVPSDTPVPTLPQPQLTRYTYEGISISYDPELASAVEPETVEEETGFVTIPRHTSLVFSDYPRDPEAHKAQISFFRVPEYQALDPDFGDRFATLQQLLLQRPTTGLPQPMPFFPSWHAGQVIAARVGYLDFQNGSGVRYLTQYAQDAYPINNQGLFYTFQGITSDNQWLVSAVLPVSTSILPDPETVVNEPGFYDNFEKYLSGIRTQLYDLPAADFEPDISVLDAIIESLEVK